MSYADNLLAELGNATASSHGTIACTGLNRSDASTPIEIETAGSSVTAYLWGVSYNSAVAAGTDASNGTAITRQHNIVTGADGTTGVVLPELVAATQNYSTPIVIYNDDTTNTLKVWSVTTTTADTINGTTNLLVPAKCVAIFYPIAANKWYGGVIFKATTLTTFTQTYSTATATVATATVAAVATTASTQTTPFGYAGQAQADAIPVAINALTADALADRKALNALIDACQAAGIVK